jgi:carboxyl-terminal processing protease
MKKSFLIILWLGLVLMTATCMPQRRPQLLGGASPVGRYLKVFDAVWATVNDKYFDAKFNGTDWARARETFRPQAAVAGSERDLYDLLNRMLTELHDPHTWVVAPADLGRQNSHLNVDLGFTGKVIDNQLVITRVRDGSSAYKAGIQTGWILTHWDGVPVDTARLSGFALGDGQAVQLSFLDAQDHTRDVRMIAQTYTAVPERTARLLDGGVLYIRFENFYAADTGKWFASVLARNGHAPACVVDLRGNPGGLAAQLKQTLEPLYARATEFGQFVERAGQSRPLRVSGRGKKAYNGIVIVLIDEGTSSAAELFAAAVQESGRGKIVGRTSAGSALNNKQERLPDGGQLNVSVRDYVTIRGRRIEGHGVAPDEPVALSLSAVRLNVDRDLERALQLFK